MRSLRATFPRPSEFAVQRVTAKRIDPDDVVAWCGLGIALASCGDRTGALVALRHALSRDATHGPSLLALGKLLFDCGQVEHALRCFDCAMQVNPS